MELGFYYVCIWNNWTKEMIWHFHQDDLPEEVFRSKKNSSETSSFIKFVIKSSFLTYYSEHHMHFFRGILWQLNKS